MDARVCHVNSKEFCKLIDGLEVSPFMKLKQNQDMTSTKECNSGDLPFSLADLTVSDTLYCSFCGVGFLNQLIQREHYKLDWHRYNLKLHLAQRKPVSEEKFNQMAGDVSSISGSDSESETDEGGAELDKEEDDGRLSRLIARRSRVLFNNSAGNVLSLNRCLLLNKKEEAESDEYLIDLVKKLSVKSTWLIVMLGGGHFAAAIFRDGEPVVHKTFHSYTVRAKQGGSQSGKDGKGTHAKSSGASMRRYNEQSLTQHVQDTMRGWGPDINKCDYIFYRAIGRSNSSVLFSGSNAPLLRSDPRVRTIPFTTRRPTFNEVNRVYQLLSTVFVYDSNEMFRTRFTPVQKPVVESGEKDLTGNADSSVPQEGNNSEQKSSNSKPQQQKQTSKVGSLKKIDRGKERPPPDRKLPGIVQSLADETSSDDSRSLIIEATYQEISFMDDLKEYDCDFGKDKIEEVGKVKPKRKKKEKKIQDIEVEQLKPEVENIWRLVHSGCTNGDLEAVQLALDKASSGDASQGAIDKEDLIYILNQKNINGLTVLHEVASKSLGEIARLLMLHGGDPCIKDKKTLTPYDHCPDKLTRNIFRRFMGEFPDMYDYSKSHIPSILNDDAESEMAEKRKAARKAKRQRLKEKKEAAEVIRQEDEERQRFLALSDREKRALAAERRMLANQGVSSKSTDAAAISRCFLCGTDISGKVPFEYANNRFCTMDCLKKHRITVKLNPTNS